MALLLRHNEPPHKNNKGIGFNSLLSGLVTETFCSYTQIPVNLCFNSLLSGLVTETVDFEVIWLSTVCFNSLLSGLVTEHEKLTHEKLTKMASFQAPTALPAVLSFDAGKIPPFRWGMRGD